MNLDNVTISHLAVATLKQKSKSLITILQYCKIFLKLAFCVLN